MRVLVTKEKICLLLIWLKKIAKWGAAATGSKDEVPDGSGGGQRGWKLVCVGLNVPGKDIWQKMAQIALLWQEWWCKHFTSAYSVIKTIPENNCVTTVSMPQAKKGGDEPTSIISAHDRTFFVMTKRWCILYTYRHHRDSNAGVQWMNAGDFKQVQLSQTKTRKFLPTKTC